MTIGLCCHCDIYETRGIVLCCNRDIIKRTAATAKSGRRLGGFWREWGRGVAVVR